MNSTSKHIITLALAMLSLCHIAWGQKTVSNISAAQRPGTKLVDITYDLNYGTAKHVKVGLQVSSNGGTTWNIAVTSVSGDVGLNVASGTGKTIVWDAGADWNGQQGGNILYRVTANDLDEMVFIPAGNFVMGDTFEDGFSFAIPTRTVSISAFSMAKTEVTKAQWDEVVNWSVTHGYDLQTNYGKGKAADHPVYDIYFTDCLKWLNAKSEMEGFTPVYTVAGATYKTGGSFPTVNYAVNGYRLPTEAEWEKAARGGLYGKRFPWGDTIDHNYANYRANGGGSYDQSPYSEDTYHPTYNDGVGPYTSPVGSFAANGYGLFDMAGNVQERCSDWFGWNYYAESGNTVDPVGPNSTGLAARVARGGSYLDHAGDCRVSKRYEDVNYLSTGDSMGLRPVRRP